MSVLAIIFAIFSVFISLWGLFAFFLGLTLFFLLPVISAATSFKKPAHFLFWLATQPINRAAIVVSEHNDILFKPMRFDGIGVEVIKIDGEEKVFEDPDAALHYWLGIPFAMADEKSGVLFDPRHAALGQRKHDLDERGESEYYASDSEWEFYGISKWKPGVFEMPHCHELVDLSKIRQLVDGGERSEYAKRVEELYKHSRDPFGSGTPISKFFYPIIGFGIPFFGIWILSSQLGTPNGGASSTVGWGSSVLWLLAVTADDDRIETMRRLALAFMIVGFGVLPVVAVFVALAVFISPIFALGLFLALLFGFLTLPALSFLSRPIGAASAAFANLFFRLGFMGYSEPVFEWHPDEYRLREFRDLDETAPRPTWYGLFGSKVGFTFTPGPEAWGAENLKHETVEAMQEARTDGGSSTTNLPRKYIPAPELQRDTYGAFVPTRLKDGYYYLHSGIAMARFKNSAVGEKSLRRLLEAKEKFGSGESSLSDKAVLYLTAGGGFLGIILGVLLFIL